MILKACGLAGVFEVALADPLTEPVADCGSSESMLMPGVARLEGNEFGL